MNPFIKIKNKNKKRSKWLGKKSTKLNGLGWKNRKLKDPFSFMNQPYSFPSRKGGESSYDGTH